MPIPDCNDGRKRGYRKTSRKMPARQCPIADPIPIAKFWKSPRDRKQSVVLAIKHYEGHTFLDCRLFGTNAEGQSVPTAKGLTIGMARLLEFSAAVTKAVERAKGLGLLDDDGAG
jgi:hypothetical protein